MYRTTMHPKGPSYTKNQLQVVKEEALPGAPKKFIVEKILEKKKEKGKIFFKIKWKGFPADKNSWEPRTQLIKDVPTLIKDFEKKTKST